MLLASVPTTPDPFPPDAILIAGGSAATLDLLRLATIRSDTVLVMGEHIDAATRLYAARFAVEVVGTAPAARDIAGAASLLVAVDDLEGGNALVRAARRSGVPVHVSGRPLVSDFTMLEFLEGRPGTFAAGASPR